MMTDTGVGCSSVDQEKSVKAIIEKNKRYRQDLPYPRRQRHWRMGRSSSRISLVGCLPSAMVLRRKNNLDLERKELYNGGYEGKSEYDPGQTL